MDIIVVSTKRGRSWRFRFNGILIGCSALVLVALSSGLMLFGYKLQLQSAALPQGLLSHWADEIRAQHRSLLTLRSQMQDNSQALSKRLAELQARVMRLDAAGKRMSASIKSTEFNFDEPPPLGGPENDVAGPSLNVEQSLVALNDFETQLDNRERKLRVLEDLLLANRLQHDVRPSGWPIEDGWISSKFGWRNDPFTGRLANHAGIDFAGRLGEDVLAVAAGVVTDAGDRYGYGELVEINHGNGYVTRYGHNKRVLVKVGDQVKKGSRIALMGETGRATGPHVHFEVLLDGKVQDPVTYIEAAR